MVFEVILLITIIGAFTGVILAKLGFRRTILGCGKSGSITKYPLPI
jgi:hypothetical protein